MDLPLLSRLDIYRDYRVLPIAFQKISLIQFIISIVVHVDDILECLTDECDDESEVLVVESVAINPIV